MKKVLIVFGTRPEAIKMAPIVRELKNNPSFETKVCVTAQHREMLDAVLELFEINPDFDLNIMQAANGLSEIATLIMERLSQVLEDYQPDCVAVHGDTSSAFVAGLCSYYHRIPVVHVEAGLRSHDLNCPWPEEIHRVFIAKLASCHLAPTQLAARNLYKEGVPRSDVYVTGNSVIDALGYVETKLEQPDISDRMKRMFPALSDYKKIILFTCHRRENVDSHLERILAAVVELARSEREVEIVFPRHPNPALRAKVNKILAEFIGGSQLDNFHLIESLDYLPFVYLMKRSYLILSDSGGLQEEVPALGKPLVLLRQRADRQDTERSGGMLVCGTETSAILKAVRSVLHNRVCYSNLAQIRCPYGQKGEVSGTIVNALKKFLYCHDGKGPEFFPALPLQFGAQLSVGVGRR